MRGERDIDALTINALEAWHVVHFARERGISLRVEDLVGTGAPPPLEARIPVGELAKAWEALEVHLGPDAPYLVAQDRIAAPQSVIRFVAEAQPTLGDAARVSVAYAGAITELWSVAIEPEGTQRRVVWLPADGSWPVRRGVRLMALYEIADWALAGRYMTGGAFRPSEVRVPWCSHEAPSKRAERIVGAPVRMGAAHLALVAPAASFDIRVRGGDQKMRAFLRRQADEVLSRVGAQATWGNRARAAVLAELPDPAMAALARRMGTSSRSLHRHLAAEGLSVRGVVDRVRRELAQSWLPHRSVAEVADALGYADARSLRRAFRRWTGEAPHAWRRRHR